MPWYGWREMCEFSCEECGEDVRGRQGEDVVCPHCEHANLYEPPDPD
jgi:DNA-directed RNA polymerase subunit RPC12/RpoP